MSSYTICNNRSKLKIILFLMVIIVSGIMSFLGITDIIAILNKNVNIFNRSNIFTIILTIIFIQLSLTYLSMLITGPFGKTSFNLKNDNFEVNSMTMIGNNSVTLFYKDIKGIELLPKSGEIEIRTDNNYYKFGNDLERSSAFELLSELLKRTSSN